MFKKLEVSYLFEHRKTDKCENVVLKMSFKRFKRLPQTDYLSCFN